MPSKWIEIASSEVPASEVAADAIRLRVRHVQELLPVAAHEFQDDIEHIHRLRVACRRADATLKAFRPLLGGKYKSLQKWLRRIRRAAGPARDLDVLLARLQKESSENSNRVSLVAQLIQQRSESQQALLQVAAESKSKKFDRSLERCLNFLSKKTCNNSTTSIGKFAKKSLQKASRPVLRQAAIWNPSLEQLHELRIAGKRLRYSIEIFDAALNPGLRTELYPLIEKLQSRLGRMNDHATAQSIFQNLLAEMPADNQDAYLTRCLVEQHEAAELLREEFLQWWTPERIAALETHLEACA